jgi:hypothetical protein
MGCPVREPGDQRVLGRQYKEGRAEERVRPGGEDRQVDVELFDPEDHLGALRAPDPVPLHRQDALGPRFEQLHLLEQPVGVGSDTEEPLLEPTGLHEVSAPLAAPVDHLLVGEHGLVVRAPVDRRLLAVGEPRLEELEEEPLRPAVVLGLVRRQHALPVDRPAHSLHLPPDRGDVALRHFARVAPLRDGSVLGGKPESIETHRPHDHVPVPPPEMGDDLAQHVVAHMAHVQLAGGIGEHLEDVGLVPQIGLAGIGHVEGIRVPPDALPLLLDRLRVVLLLQADPSRNEKASLARGRGRVVGPAPPAR